MLNSSLGITHPLITIFLPLLGAYVLLIVACIGALTRTRLQKLETGMIRLPAIRAPEYFDQEKFPKQNRKTPLPKKVR